MLGVLVAMSLGVAIMPVLPATEVESAAVAIENSEQKIKSADRMGIKTRSLMFI
jgi:hypothetical protein